MKSVYSAVWTGSLNKAVCTSSLKGLRSFLKLSCHVCLILPSRHFPSDTRTTTLYGFLFFPIHAIPTCPPPPNLIPHDLISRIVFGELPYNVNQQITFRFSALSAVPFPVILLLTRHMNRAHTWPNAEVSAASPSWWWTLDGAGCYDSGLLAASNLEERHTRHVSEGDKQNETTAQL